jgi:hypothetical protein
MSRFLKRISGAAVLDAATYEEVEADPAATLQAMTVVLLAGVAAGIGAPGETSVAGTLTRVAIALVSWGVWASIIAQLGGGPLAEPQTKVDWPQLLRTLGFAAAPGIVQVLGVFGPLSGPLRILSWAWMLAAMVVAVRQALDYTQTWRAVLVCVVGGAVALAVTLVLGILFSTSVS